MKSGECSIKELPGININTYIPTRLLLKSFTDSVSTHVGFSKRNYYTTTLHHIIILTVVRRHTRLSVTKICLSVTIPSGTSHINVIEEPLQSSIRVLAGYPPPHTSIDEITTWRRRPRHKSSWWR